MIEDVELLTAVLAGLEARRSALDEQIETVKGFLQGQGANGEKSVKRVMSAAARRRISLAQKKRWREARRMRG